MGVHKGNIPWNKGIKLDREKYSNMGHYNKHSEESKQKMRIAKIGHTSWNKGKRYIAIMGEKNPSKRLEVREKIRLSKLGKKRDENTIEKMRRTMKKKWENNEILEIVRIGFEEGRKGTMITKERRKRMVLPRKNTSIEVKIQNFLKGLNIPFFTHQYIEEIEHSYQCDILIPSKNLVIECDGNYWHSYPTGKEIDHIRTSELIEKGFKVLRLWEFEIKDMKEMDFKNKLKEIEKNVAISN